MPEWVVAAQAVTSSDKRIDLRVLTELSQKGIMTRGPYQSQLIPYLEEIAKMRRNQPPTPYREIALILNEKYQLNVTYNGVWQFVRARSKSRVVHEMNLEATK